MYSCTNIVIKGLNIAKYAYWRRCKGQCTAGAFHNFLFVFPSPCEELIYFCLWFFRAVCKIHIFYFLSSFRVYFKFFRFLYVCFVHIPCGHLSLSIIPIKCVTSADSAFCAHTRHYAVSFDHFCSCFRSCSGWFFIALVMWSILEVYIYNFVFFSFSFLFLFFFILFDELFSLTLNLLIESFN